MNKMFLVGVMVFVALNIVAEEHNFSHPEIIIRIDKNGLVCVGEKKSSANFGEKIFNIGGDVVCGACMGAVFGAALMLYHETVAINNALLHAGVYVIDSPYKWNENVSIAVKSGATLGSLYGLLNGVYKNFVKS